AAENGNLESVLPGVLDRLQQQQADFISAAIAAGMERKAAEELADQLYQLPDGVVTLIEADNSSASRSVEWSIAKYDGRGSVAGFMCCSPRSPLSSLPFFRFAACAPLGVPSAGFARVLGCPPTDSIFASLSTGAFVVNSKATQENRGLLEAINSGRVTTSG